MEISTMKHFMSACWLPLLCLLAFNLAIHQFISPARTTPSAVTVTAPHAGVTAAVVPCLPLVVEITTSRLNEEGALVVSGYGSGVVVGHHGYIVTCWHVVEGEESFTVSGGDVAVLVAKDEARDLALIKVDREYTSVATWGDSSSLLAGDAVFVIGYPFDIAELVSFGGVSSAMWRMGDDSFIIIDASVNPGNSGGGLFDSCGALVGIPARTYMADGIPRNINLAIPGNAAHDFVVLNGGDQ